MDEEPEFDVYDSLYGVDARSIESLGMRLGALDYARELVEGDPSTRVGVCVHVCNKAFSSLVGLLHLLETLYPHLDSVGKDTVKEIFDSHNGVMSLMRDSRRETGGVQHDYSAG